MATKNMIEAINDAHRVMMAKDDNIVVFGEDVGYFGGVPPPGCKRNSARTGRSMRRSAKAASSALRSAWPPMASSP